MLEHPPRRRLSERRSCKSGRSVSRAPLCSRHISARQRRDLVPITIVRPYEIIKELAFDLSCLTASKACDLSVLTRNILRCRWCAFKNERRPSTIICYLLFARRNVNGFVPAALAFISYVLLYAAATTAAAPLCTPAPRRVLYVFCRARPGGCDAMMGGG